MVPLATNRLTKLVMVVLDGSLYAMLGYGMPCYAVLYECSCFLKYSKKKLLMLYCISQKFFINKTCSS